MIDENDKNFSPLNGNEPKPGPFLAKVVSNIDPTYMGVLEVEILRPSGSDGSPTGLQRVRYMTPFYGATNVEYNDKSPDTFASTQSSYGMWFVPPDVGAIVVVIFVNGDPKNGFWMGCVMDDNMNFMIPGIAATQSVVGSTKRTPAGEYNKLINTQIGDPERIKKPVHPMAAVLTAQGLANDDTRGTTTSSARRESPSSVFGISTPGPLDKTSTGKKKPVGKVGSQRNMYVTRLGGTTLVMDDGDANFLRKGAASSTPPVYASVEQDEKGGDPKIPHNELFRIRTRTGHQILLHNSEDLIYIGNAKGTTWIEMTSNGKIDIYAGDSISMHTKGDFNVTADNNINLTAGGAVNVNAGGKFEVQSAGTDIDGGDINLNSGTASAPKASRVPMAEPWAGHENLHGSGLKPSTVTDTFLKEKK